jgi:hypothetical protein
MMGTREFRSGVFAVELISTVECDVSGNTTAGDMHRYIVLYKGW